MGTADVEIALVLTGKTGMRLQIYLTPHGRFVVRAADESDDDVLADVTVDDAIGRELTQAFQQSAGAGLLQLAAVDDRATLPVVLAFWRNWARRLLKTIASLDDASFEKLEKTAASRRATGRQTATALVRSPDDLELAVIAAEAPPMRGLEYLTPVTLKENWSELVGVFLEQAAGTEGGCSGLLRLLNPELHLLGRVTLHLAENKRDPQRPFAFMATYAHRLSAKAQIRHLPLAEALRQYAAEQHQAKLAELLAPVREAAERSSVVRELLDSRAVFQPQAWSIGQAHRFLQDVPAMEESGLSVRVPDWWKSRTSARPQVQIRIGDQQGSAVGLDALLDFRAELTLDGVPLTNAERQQLMAASDGLTLLRGRWVEVDQQKLDEALRHWDRLSEQHADGVTFLDGMRLLAGVPVAATESSDDVEAWSRLVPGEWLAETLQKLRDPGGVTGCEPGVGLQATLRHYQADGVRWLWFMTQLGLGGCLADDMGLGKTVQVIDLILRLKSARQPKAKMRKRRVADEAAELSAFLLVVPASLVGNWKQELQRFAPQLRVLIAHRSETDSETLQALDRRSDALLDDYDVVVTTYTMLRTSKWPHRVSWQLAVLDEAQAIKNAGSSQSKAARKLSAKGRIALTGTPVENNLGDLWSLFDFCVPGLLGSVGQFRNFVRRTKKQQNTGAMSALRKLVKPYILRRMKTDPAVVPDLPDKTEVTVECCLSRQQAALYEQIVRDVSKQLEQAEGIQRRGLVLSMLMRLKQLCNHPSLFLSQPDYLPDDSGKFQVLRRICEVIRERQEKVLVFTQFKSMCQPLDDYLAALFRQRGVTLHGGVPVGKRRKLVDTFQNSDDVPYFVISVKAGGTGLNLTTACHVVHFDRWWNPAVENQATDRAFRIGQKRNVLVQKFVCRGTVEERIDEMIRNKQELADELLGGASEKLITEMTDDQLLEFVSLDVSRAFDDD